MIVENGHKYHYGGLTKQLVSDLILSRAAHFQYQSEDSIKEGVKVVSELISEAALFVKEELEIKMAKAGTSTKAIKEEKAALSRLVAKVVKFSDWAQKAKTRDSLIRNIYNFVLTLEGMNTLPGFRWAWTQENQMCENAERVGRKLI